MTALIIIFSILLFLFLISLIKINVIAEYRDKPKVTLKILFIKINIIKEKKAFQEYLCEWEEALIKYVKNKGER